MLKDKKNKYGPINLRTVLSKLLVKLKDLGSSGGCEGQTPLQLVLPLLVILSVLVAFAMVIPSLSPTKTLALGAGLVIFVVSFASTEMALYVLIFSMLLSPEFIFGTTEGATLGRGVTLRIDDFLLAIIGFSWLAKMSINKEMGLFLKTPINRPVAIYMTICLISTLFGSVLGRVDLKTGFFFVLKYFEYMIVFFMVVNNLRDRKQLERYLWALLITCAIVSLMGIFQIPGGGRVSAPFEGEGGEPNTFGGYLVLMISIVTGMLLTSSKGRDQMIFVFLLILFTIPLLYTRSRGSYVAIIPALLTFLLLSEKRQWLVPLFLFLGIVLPFIAPNPTKERVVFTFTQGRSHRDVVEVAGVKLDTSTSARLLSWARASKDWVKHPVFGYGVTGYSFVDAQYFRVITETGFSGLVAFFILISTIFRSTLKIFKQSSEPVYKGLSMGFLAGFIGLLFHAIGANTFIIVRIMEPFWFAAALVFMIPNLMAKDSTRDVTV